jgi:inosine/xanthosine triphosphate pyrophosphatase family protein
MQHRGEQKAGGAAAYFVCALARRTGMSNGSGRLDGTLVWPPRGARDLGPDPKVVPEGHMHDRSFGEMNQYLYRSAREGLAQNGTLYALCSERT